MTTNRRSFLKTSAAGAAALALPASLLAGQSPNETIQIGILGSGGRARHLLKSLVKIPNVNVKTVCDVWDDARNQTVDQLAADQNRPETRNDYQAVLDDPEIDAVLIASPDHWHARMTIDACKAGKDVYVEKPLTHWRDDGQEIIDAENSSGRIVQVGTQQRSMPHLTEAREIVRSGELGTIH